MTDENPIAAAAKRIRSEFGRLDLLINNAAISNTHKTLGMSLQEYVKISRPSNVPLDEVSAVWGRTVRRHRCDPSDAASLARSTSSPHRQCIERRWLIDDERGSSLSRPLDVRPRLTCVQDGL